MRIDLFIQKHVNYLHGIMKIADKDSVNADDKFHVSLTNTSLNEPIINTNLSDTNNSCPACQNNNHPTGTHICCLCQKYVHALPQCSLSFGRRKL